MSSAASSSLGGGATPHLSVKLILFLWRTKPALLKARVKAEVVASTMFFWLTPTISPVPVQSSNLLDGIGLHLGLLCKECIIFL